MADGDTNVWVGTTNAYGTAGNWSLGTAPVEGEHIVIPAESAQAIAASDQSATSLRSFTIEDGYGENIGDEDDYLQIRVTYNHPSTYVDISPTGSIVSLDLGCTAVEAPINIRNSGTPAAGEYAVQIKGVDLGTINVYKGVVGIGVEPGDVTTEITNLFVSHKTEAGKASDAQVTIGAGVEGPASAAITSIRQIGGKIWNNSAATVTALDVTDGEYHQTDGLWTTAIFSGSSKIFPRDLGTCGTTKLYGTSKVTHFGLNAIAYTNLLLNPGVTWIDKQLRNTHAAAKIEIPGGLGSVNLDMGTNIDIHVTAS